MTLTEAPADGLVVPKVVQAWVAQLLDPEFLAIVAAADGQVDVTLSAAKGRIRRKPTIVVHGGPQEWTDT